MGSFQSWVGLGQISGPIFGPSAALAKSDQFASSNYSNLTSGQYKLYKYLVF